VLTAKTVTFSSLAAASAAVLPEIARRFQPQLLQQLSRQVKRGVILIAGTNGKTTTSLCTMLERQNWRVAHNATGANLEI